MNPLPKRILIVDDAATVRMYYRSILAETDYQLEEAINGIEALEKTLHQAFDLYLVDINMPKQDGYSFLRELRRQSIPQVPAVMISTEAQRHDRAQALEAGANLYLIKPVKPEELRAACDLLLGMGGGKA